MSERLSLATIALACLALGFVLYVSTGHDDAYITYWASHALATTGEILNYNGDRVEQSSSLLHTLLLAGLARATGASLVSLGYWLGVLGGALTVLRAPALARALGADAPRAVAAAVGTTPVLLYWSFGGLETTLAAWLQLEAALLGAQLVAGARSPLSPLVWLVTFAFAAVRPEAMLVLGAALVVWLAAAAPRRAPGARPLALWLVVALAALAALVTFRLAYFGAPFPQPVIAKRGGFEPGRLLTGLDYAAKLFTRPFAPALAALVVAAPFLAWRERAAPSARLFVLLLVGANLAFAVCVGGDSMIGGRFFAPVAALAVASGAAALPPRWLASRTLFAALLAAQLAGVLGLAAAGTGRPLWVWLADDPRDPELSLAHWSERANRVHRRDLHFAASAARVITSLLARQERVSIASVQAGMVVYYTKLRFGDRVVFYDLKALSTRDFMFLRDTAGLGGNSWGLDLDLPEYLAFAREHREPAFHPDLLFDIRPNGPLAEKNGYATVLEQAQESPGFALALGPLRLGGALQLYQWAAVRRELLAR